MAVRFFSGHPVLFCLTIAVAVLVVLAKTPYFSVNYYLNMTYVDLD